MGHQLLLIKKLFWKGKLKTKNPLPSLTSVCGSSLYCRVVFVLTILSIYNAWILFAIRAAKSAGIGGELDSSMVKYLMDSEVSPQ